MHPCLDTNARVKESLGGVTSGVVHPERDGLGLPGAQGQVLTVCVEPAVGNERRGVVRESNYLVLDCGVACIVNQDRLAESPVEVVSAKNDFLSTFGHPRIGRYAVKAGGERVGFDVTRKSLFVRTRQGADAELVCGTVE